MDATRYTEAMRGNINERWMDLVLHKNCEIDVGWRKEDLIDKSWGPPPQEPLQCWRYACRRTRALASRAAVHAVINIVDSGPTTFPRYELLNRRIRKIILKRGSIPAVAKGKGGARPRGGRSPVMIETTTVSTIELVPVA